MTIIELERQVEEDSNLSVVMMLDTLRLEGSDGEQKQICDSGTMVITASISKEPNLEAIFGGKSPCQLKLWELET